jgi:hypothetical protein
MVPLLYTASNGILQESANQLDWTMQLLCKHSDLDLAMPRNEPKCKLQVYISPQIPIKRDLSYFDVRAPGPQMTHRTNLDLPQSEIETETK